MVGKRLAEYPPPAVSFSDDEGEESGTEEEEEEHHNGTVPFQNGTNEKQNNDEDGSEDDEDKEDDDADDDEEEEEETDKPNQPLSEPSKPDSESDSETESEKSGSTEPPSPSLSGFSIKSISPKQKRVADVTVKRRKTVVNGERDGEEDLWEKYPYLRSSLNSEFFPEELKKSAMLILGMAREEKLAELDRKWKSLMIEKLELSLKRSELADEYLKSALDAMKSEEDS